MLVCSRKVNESIVIGSGPEQVEVMVVRIAGDKVRIGVKDPPTMPVDRSEVRRAIEQQGGQRKKASQRSDKP